MSRTVPRPARERVGLSDNNLWNFYYYFHDSVISIFTEPSTHPFDCKFWGERGRERERRWGSGGETETCFPGSVILSVR